MTDTSVPDAALPPGGPAPSPKRSSLGMTTRLSVQTVGQLLAVAIVLLGLGVPDKEFHAKTFKANMIAGNILHRVLAQ